MRYVSNNPARSGAAHRQTNRPLRPATLSDLRAVKATFEHQLAEMEKAGNKFGIKMRMNMIEAVEAQIAAL